MKKKKTLIVSLKKKKKKIPRERLRVTRHLIFENNEQQKSMRNSWSRILFLRFLKIFQMFQIQQNATCISLAIAIPVSGTRFENTANKELMFLI